MLVSSIEGGVVSWCGLYAGFLVSQLLLLVVTTVCWQGIGIGVSGCLVRSITFGVLAGVKCGLLVVRSIVSSWCPLGVRSGWIVPVLLALSVVLWFIGGFVVVFFWLGGVLRPVGVACCFCASFILVWSDVAHLIVFVCVSNGFFVLSVAVWGISAHLLAGLV